MSPETQQAPPSAVTLPPRPPLRAVRYAIGYAIFVALLVGAALWAMSAYRGWIDEHQRSRERYAAERAIEALDAGNVDEARLQIEMLALERPLYKGGLFNRRVSDVWEGAVYRNRVTIYEDLCARLLKAGMVEQARTVAWKSLFEYHIAPRTLEMINSWELASLVSAAGNDWYGAFQSARILAAHGAEAVRTPAQMDPVAKPENPAMFAAYKKNIPPDAIMAMRILYEQPSAGQFNQAINLLERARPQAASPAVANQIDVLLHQAFLASGQPQRARQLLARKWGRDPGFMDEFWKTWPNAAESFMTEREPSLMDFMWAERPDDSRPTVAHFIDSFKYDPRVQVYDITGLKEADLGYFNEKNKFHVIGDSLGMFNNVAGTLPVQTNAATYQIAIGYKGTPALGIAPILLLQIDDSGYIPIYCESSEQAIATVDVNMSPGAHTLSFVYINDGSFDYPARNISEDRNLLLYRVALIQVRRPG